MNRREEQGSSSYKNTLRFFNRVSLTTITAGTLMLLGALFCPNQVSESIGHNSHNNTQQIGDFLTMAGLVLIVIGTTLQYASNTIDSSLHFH